MIAPIVRPVTSCRCATHPAIRTGITAAVAAADILAINRSPCAALKVET